MMGLHVGRFELSACFIGGHQRVVAATSDGVGWQVETTARIVPVRSVDQAVRIARRQMEPLLRRVSLRPGWNLRVSVASVAAFYGAPGLDLALQVDGREDTESLAARIRADWHDGDGALPALDNALKIVDAYADRRPVRLRRRAPRISLRPLPGPFAGR
jgi:hypothetical protein